MCKPCCSIFPFVSTALACCSVSSATLPLAPSLAPITRALVATRLLWAPCAVVLAGTAKAGTVHTVTQTMTQTTQIPTAVAPVVAMMAITAVPVTAITAVPVTTMTAVPVTAITAVPVAVAVAVPVAAMTVVPVAAMTAVTVAVAVAVTVAVAVAVTVAAITAETVAVAVAVTVVVAVAVTVATMMLIMTATTMSQPNQPQNRLISTREPIVKVQRKPDKKSKQYMPASKSLSFNLLAVWKKISQTKPNAHA